MSVVTSNLNDVNSYPGIQLKIELLNYPMVTPITKTFQVDITCTVTTLAFDVIAVDPLANKSIGVFMDPQPQDMFFSVTKTPNCVQDPTYTLAPTLTFVTETINADGESGKVQVHDATLAHQGVYNMVFTATVDGQTATSTFDVEIFDPCRSAIFETSPNPMSLMNIVMPTTGLTDQTVKVWTDIERLSAPNICPITATLAPSKAFMSLAADFSKVTVDADQIVLPTDVGTHTFTLTVDEMNWAANVLQTTYNFDVLIECNVSALSVDQSAADKNYILNEGAHVTQALLVSQTSACNYPYSYTHACTKDGVAITMPAWINFDDSTKQYTITVTDPPDIGVYVITATTAIPPNPVSGLFQTIDSSFTLTVVSDCTISAFETLGLTDMTQGVSVPVKDQNIFFTDTISTGHTQPNYCGTRQYVLSPDTATFPFIYIDGDTVKVYTTDESWIGGPYAFTITATLTDYAMVAAHSESFNVFIICGVQTHAWVAPEVPAYTTLQIGIDTLPWEANFLTTQFPNCGNQVTFTITPDTDPFMTLTTLGIENGKVTVDNATIGQHGVYSYTLLGVVDTQPVQTDFQVFIKDPCSTSIFELTPAPLVDMQVIMYYQTTETQTQNVKIWTDVERSYSSIICPITAVLTPSLPYISLSADYTTILVDASFASDLDVGLHPMTLTVENAVFPNPAVLTAVYTFTLDLKACEVADFVFVNTITSFTYMITDPRATTLPVLATLNNLNCLFPITYTQTYKRDGVLLASEPTYLARDPVSSQFNVETSLKADLGVYTVDVFASIPQVLLPGGIKTITFTFDVTIESDCKISVIDDRAINFMQTIMWQHETQDTTFTNTRATIHNDLLHCGDYQFVLDPVYPFLNVLNTAGTGPYTLDLYSENVNECSQHSVTMTVSLPEFPVITPVVKNFDVKILCNILSIDANPMPPANSQYIIQVTSVLKIPFDFTPTPGCFMDVTISPDPNIYSWTLPFQVSNKELVVQTRDLGDEGVYTLKFTAFPRVDYSVGVTKEVEFQIALVNACQTTQFEGRVANLEILRQNPEFKVDNIIDLSGLETLADKMGVDCGLVMFTVSNKNPDDPEPTWIRSENVEKRLIVNLSEETEMSFTRNLLLDMQLQNYPHIKYQTNFNVTLSSAGFECLPNASKTIITGDPDYIFGILYSNQTNIKDIKLTQIAETFILDDQQREISLPGFAKFNKNSLQYKIADPKFEQLGLYQFGLKLGYREFPGAEVYCLKTVQIEYKTRFKGDIPNNIIIPCEIPYLFTLPEYIGVFNIVAKIDLQLNEVQDFLMYDTDTRKLTSFLEQQEFCKYAGMTYTMDMVLTDSVKGQISYKINVSVTNIDKVTLNSEGNFNWNQAYALPPPKPVIQFVNQMGYVRVTFTRPIQLPTYDRYPEFRDEQNMRLNCTNGALEACLKEENAAEPGQAGTERKLQSKTEKEQELREALEITNKGLVMQNNTMWPIIELDMLPGSEETDEVIIKQFNWEVVDFKEEYMDFQLLYNKFHEISIHQAADLLKVNFIGRQYFKAPDGQYFQESVTIQKKAVPTQVDPVLGKQMQSLGEAASDLGVAFGIGNFLLNLFLGGILSEMFAVLSKLQIMLHLLIANVPVPPQTMIFMQGLLALVTFQIIEFDFVIIPMFGLKEETEMINDNLYYLGYTSTYFVVNMGNVLIFAFGTTALALFIVCSAKCKNERVKKLHDSAHSMLIWNGAFRLMKEPYVIYVVSCMTQTLAMTWSNHGERFNNLLMICMFFVIVAFPLWVIFFIQKNKEKLKLKSFMKKYSTIYEHLKWKTGDKWVLMEPGISSVRMFFTIAALIYLQSWRYFQLMIAMYFHYAVIIYNGQIQPFKSKTYHFFQQFNEVFVFWTILILMTFADVILDQHAFDTMGYVLIAVVVSNLFINMISILGKAIRQNMFKYKIKYLLWRRKKLRASIELKRSLYAEEQQAAFALANAKQPLSPRALKTWHRLRKDLGLSYDAQMVDLSQEVSFNSEARLVESKGKAQALAANPLQLLFAKPANDEGVLDKNELEVSQDEEEKQPHPLVDQFGYAISNETAQRMDQFYSDEKLYRKTFDNGGSEFQRTAAVFQTQLKPLPIMHSPLNDSEYIEDTIRKYEESKRLDNMNAMHIEEDTPQTVENKNFDHFNEMYTNYLQQKPANNLDADHWGQPMTTIRKEAGARNRRFISQDREMNVLESYVQRGDDLDDQAAHSLRVQQRKESARNVFGSSNQARELFDKLWQNENNANSGRGQAVQNQTGLVNIKTIKGNQPISVLPAHHRRETLDHWGNP